MGTVSWSIPNREVLLAEMKINILDGEHMFVYECSPADTVLVLKEKIEEGLGIEACNQWLYLHGYWISDDGSILGDFMKDEDELTLKAATATDPLPSKTKKFRVPVDDVWIISGSKRKFTTHLIPKNRNVPIKLKSDSFGLIYHIEGEQQGKRKYQAFRYNVQGIEDISIDTIDGELEVFNNGEKLEPADATVYDERRSKYKTEVAMDTSNSCKFWEIHFIYLIICFSRSCSR